MYVVVNTIYKRSLTEFVCVFLFYHHIKFRKKICSFFMTFKTNETYRMLHNNEEGVIRKVVTCR
jgi:hypothetical protein